jgi:hypothetical protein
MSDPLQTVAKEVDRQIQQHGSLRSAARALDIQACTLASLRDRKIRNPSARQLIKLGFRREVRYVRL